MELIKTYIKGICTAMAQIPKELGRNYGMMVTKKFYDNFKHILFINKFVGLFPVHVSKTGDFYTLQWSWLKVIVGNFFVLMFAILMLTGTLLSYTVEEVYNVRLKGLSALMSTLAEIISLLSTWIIGQISVSIRFKEFWKYLFHLIQFDNVLGTPALSRKILTTIVIVFTFTFTCLGMDIYMWAIIVVPYVGPLNFLWQMVPFYYTYIFAMILETNLWIAIYSVTARMEKLKTLMQSYVHLAYQFDETTDANENIIRVCNGKRKTIFQCNMLTTATVKNFVTAYGSLAESVLALNKFLGLALSILLLQVIICLVITPYILYQQILNAKEMDFLFTQSYWMTCHVLRLLLLIEPCHEGQMQSGQIRKMVTRIMGLDLPKDTYKQVKVLWAVVSDNSIEFSASGMAFVNRTLLPTIGSAVFTYLAILFQYKNNT